MGKKKKWLDEEPVSFNYPEDSASWTASMSDNELKERERKIRKREKKKAKKAKRKEVIISEPDDQLKVQNSNGTCIDWL